MPEFEVYPERIALPDRTQLRVSILVTDCPIKEDGAHLIITPCATAQEVDEKVAALVEKLDRAREVAKSSLIGHTESEPEKLPEIALIPLPLGERAKSGSNEAGEAKSDRPEIELIPLPSGRGA
ncbi:MAG: hypothetical protein ACREKL_04500 [Chthoniobacterales bacterium]